jgi:hypothetical protein
MGQAEVEFEGQRKEPGNTLLAFDGKAHPRPLQEVSDASAPAETCLKRLPGYALRRSAER